MSIIITIACILLGAAILFLAVFIAGLAGLFSRVEN